MNSVVQQMTYLRDYQPPQFWVDTVDLKFDLSAEKTRVMAQMSLRRNVEHAAPSQQLVLDGGELTLVSVQLEGETLSQERYQASPEQLTINDVPDAFTLCIETEINPKANSKLSGLFVSNDTFCSQCEAQGFRRITYFLDRPDVLATYSTEIIADKARYPILLSNGNLLESGELADGRHWAKYADPFPKPCYLFALVAGDLAHVGDSFTTLSGKAVALNIYVEKGEEDKCGHAMQALKNAMAWDEKAFGREYDLEIFNIVAVSDFNMGAMENKSLNIFNSQYILARPDTATDTDYEYIESVIGHEYFHNWTGDRITCRDWFQLSLKEGLTVYRDQEFSQYMNNADVVRIRQVQRLRESQFSEDSGPLAHSIRPEAYLRIDNFYTMTIYEKGAEVIRMIATMVGRAGFRKGMDCYFERHDGQAVTIEDFVKAMEDANQIDLGQFRLWYSQAGTPHVKVLTHYDEQKQTFSLQISQQTSATPGQAHKQALLIPIKVVLYHQQGNVLPLVADVSNDAVCSTQPDVLLLTQPEQVFTFQQVESHPIVSVLRDFSAPVRLDINYSDDALCFLLQHDDNGFARWEAAQMLAKRYLHKLIHAEQTGATVVLSEHVIEAYQKILEDEAIDPAYKAELLSLPSEATVITEAEQVDPDAFYAAHRRFKRELAAALTEKHLRECYQRYESQSANRETTAQVFAARHLKQVLLGYLMMLGSEAVTRDVLRAYYSAQNMTDQLGTLRLLAQTPSAEREEALQDFYQTWKDDFLIVNKWLTIQAVAQVPDALAQVKALLKHPAFTYSNPNRIRALIGAFASHNYINFHAKDGSGYAFLSEQIAIIDKLNPTVAARLVTPLTHWQKYDNHRAELMRAQLQQLMANKDLSKESYEIVSKGIYPSRTNFPDSDGVFLPPSSV